MGVYKERSFKRANVEANVQVIIEPKEAILGKEYCYIQARTLNMDKGGMCFESLQQITPNANVCIRMVEPFAMDTTDREACKVHYAKVKWCKEIDNKPGYGIGVQIFDTVVQAEIR